MTNNSKRNSAVGRAAEFAFQSVKADVSEVRSAVGISFEGMDHEEIERRDFWMCLVAVSGTGFGLMYLAISLVNILR